MKFILTGGHLTPAHAFALECLPHHDSLAVIGSLPPNTPEFQVFHQLNVPYHRILPVKLNRYHIFTSLLRLPLLLVSLLQALIILNRYSPDAVIVFGGYIGVPVALAAKLFGIPVVLHEQTRSVGLANRLISRWADLTAISYESSRQYLHTRHIVLTNNLLRPEIWQPPDTPSFSLPTDQPILFITGGNQGSAAILEAVAPLLPNLAKQFQLVIQYGRLTGQNFEQIPNLIAQSWFEANDLAWLMHHAQLIVSRAGANTVAELMVAATPAILVPLPKSSHDEQTLNAQVIAGSQAGILLPQPQLSPATLLNAINQIEAAYPDYKQAAVNLGSLQSQNAAAKFYQLIQNLIKS